MLRFAFPWLLLCLFTTALHSQELTWNDARKAFVRSGIEELLKKQDTVGAAVGIIDKGEVVFLEGFGLSDREKTLPVTTKTQFRWASISKTVTAITAMQLVEQGKLDLDKDVRQYVPEFPDKGSIITVRQLLCHQGGIVHYTNGKVVATKRDYSEKHPFESVILALDKFKESPLVNAPGEKYSYTTHGYILLSAVVERAGKQKFAEQIAERVSKPLGLTGLQPDYEWVAIPERTQGYRKVLGAITKSSDGDVSWKLGGGGLTSTIEDLTKYGKGLLDGKLVSKKMEAQMWTAQKTASGAATKYGLGFNIEKVNGKLQVSHGGSQEKTRTHLLLLPDEKRGIAFMTNSEFVNPGLVVKELQKLVWKE